MKNRSWNEKKIWKATRLFCLFMAVMLIVSSISMSIPIVSAAEKKTTEKKAVVSLEYSKYIMEKGDTLKLKADVSKKNLKKKKIVWKSSDSKIAVVSKKGVVKAKKEGIVKITAQVKGTKYKAVCRITVKPAIQNPKNASDVKVIKAIIKEQKAQGAYVSEYLNDKQYTWTEVKNKAGKNEYRLTKIDWNSKGLKGEISFKRLSALEELDCGNKDESVKMYIDDSKLNYLKKIDVTTCKALRVLICDGNYLKSLDVSKCELLSELDCAHNRLARLNVSNCTALETLDCCVNKIADLDVTKNAALQILCCEGNQLTGLDLSKNTGLTDLNCCSNELTDLDVSNHTVLHYALCNDNKLTSLNASGCSAMTFLICYSNQLTNLDVSGNVALLKLDCKNNQLTDLDVSGNAALLQLFCDENRLTNLDISHNEKLNLLHCRNNKLTNLDVSKNQELKDLECDHTVEIIGYTK